MKKVTLMFLLAGLLSGLLGCQNTDSKNGLDVIEIEAVGDNFNWYFRYPGRDGVLGTDDDEHSVQHLFLPDHAQVKLKLTSNDYLYSFALPDLQLKQIAVPDLSFELEFKSGAARTIQLLGDQFCGFSHKTLIGEVRIGNQKSNFYVRDT